ncbi:DNA mismatch endonuclease Vsr [Candidatus Saccharibacteria bacterium]|nr:DNA mismatch endonuclease Vsr [Candidatus Saccharibacteria bacterium]
MADRISRQRRSWNMSRIKSRDTIPELTVRRALYQKGYRYRIHYDIDGKPDIAFPRAKLAIFVHGCFWHQHGCKYTYRPRTRKKFWNDKLNKNITRDAQVAVKLRDRGWASITVWDCEIKRTPSQVMGRLVQIIDSRTMKITSVSTP